MLRRDLGSLLDRANPKSDFGFARFVAALLMAALLAGCAATYEVRGPENPKTWEKTAVDELEHCCGVRWWMDGDEDVPPARPISLGALDRRGRPHFLCRDIYRTTKSDPRTAVRNRLNGNGAAPAAANRLTSSCPAAISSSRTPEPRWNSQT